MISAYLDNKTCSVLEMMIALAIRCEEHIMDDPDVGNRTGQWFWKDVYKRQDLYMSSSFLRDFYRRNYGKEML